MGYYIYLLTIVVDRAAYEPYLPQHRHYLEQLTSSSKLVLSGPFADRRGGIVIVRAESEAQAHAIAEADPLVAHGVDSLELRRWRITGGDPLHIQLETG